MSSFNLIKEVNAVSNKGYAFFEYADPSVTDICIAALHGFQVGNQALTVVRTQDQQVLERHMQQQQLPMPARPWKDQPPRTSSPPPHAAAAPTPVGLAPAALAALAAPPTPVVLAPALNAAVAPMATPSMT